MVIKIVGTGCSKCSDLYDNALKALRETGKEAEVIKVEDLVEMVKLGVMSTPALVIDNKTVSTGRVLSSTEITEFLK